MGLGRHNLLEVVAIFGAQLVRAVDRELRVEVRQLAVEMGQLGRAVMFDLGEGVLDQAFDQRHDLMHIAVTYLEVELREFQQVVFRILDLGFFQTNVRRHDKDLVMTFGGQRQLFMKDHTGGQFQAPLFVLNFGGVDRVVQRVGDGRHEDRHQLSKVPLQQILLQCLQHATADNGDCLNV